MKCFGREKVGLLKGIYEKLACLLASNQFFCFVLFCLILEIIGFILKILYPCALFSNYLKFENCETHFCF